MGERIRYGLLLSVVGLGLVLVLVNIALYAGNRTLQVEVESRNLYIQQGLQLERIYQPLVRGLAELAVARDDAALRDLLASEGISFTVRAPTQAPATQQ